MCAAFQTGYQDIKNLFNHANTRAEISNTINDFFYSVRSLCLGPPPTVVRFHTLLGYPLPILECTYVLNDSKVKQNTFK